MRRGLFGPNGNYLFELEAGYSLAGAGGPEGRSDIMAGSKPISKIEPPRNVRPLVLPFSFDREPARRRFVPYPVIPLKSLGRRAASSQAGPVALVIPGIMAMAT